MANRCMLHISKLDAFKAYLNDQEIAHRPGKGEYQVLQVLTELFGWKCIYRKLEMPEHYSLDDKLVPLVYRFLGKDAPERKR
jgi:hypothetical protein